VSPRGTATGRVIVTTVPPPLPIVEGDPSTQSADEMNHRWNPNPLVFACTGGRFPEQALADLDGHPCALITHRYLYRLIRWAVRIPSEDVDRAALDGCAVECFCRVTHDIVEDLLQIRRIAV